LIYLTLVIAGSFLCAERPVPEPAALMKEVQAHQQKMDELRENYTFHRVRKVQELDGMGAVRKVTVMEREIFFVNGHQIARLIKKDGKPLSDEEEKKEQERTRKRTLECSKLPPAYGNGGGVNLIGIMLAVAEVSNPRRVEMNGRSTLAFDFKGNPKAEAHGMQANGAKKVAGTVWIDETDRQVARLEAELYDSFRVGGGLLGSVQKGTVLKIDQAPIRDGLWMQTGIEQHMNMRVVTKSVRENIEVKNFDFQRFNVDAASHAQPPAK
jgi:hypothetical protein